MKSKALICGTLAAAVAMTTFAGCITDNEKDMKQTVATVNITKSANLDESLKPYAEAIGDDNIVKRELIAAFINTGANYVNSGYSYAETFNLLVDSLVANAVVTQYSILYVLNEKVNSGDITFADYKAKSTETEKLEYLLGGANSDGVRTAKYTLYSSLNALLDSYETQYLTEGDDYTGTDTRTTPGNVDTTKEDYVPLGENGELDYYIYTGYGDYLLENAGEYEPQDGTTKISRRKAYSTFISYLKSNFLLSEEDEDTIDVLSLSYVKDEYVSQLQQSVIEEFNDLYNDNQEKLINTVENGVYTYIKDKYDNANDGLLTEQGNTYNTSSTFETALNNISDTSFVLYAPNTEGDTEYDENPQSDTYGTYGTYGFVYNILLPFSTVQQSRLDAIQSALEGDLITQSKFYQDRNELLRGIVTTDQRSAWFNGTTDYSFDAAETDLSYFDNGNSDRHYLFFENNLTKPDEYETLTNYWGRYTYNGKVTENENGSYSLVPEKLTIDDMLEEFAAYIDFVLGEGSVEYHAGDTINGGTTADDFVAYYNTKDFTNNGDEEEIDYSKLVYATGKINLTQTDKDDMFVEDTDRYKAMAAVNELQFAYTTDTAILSEYLGYSISAYETSYIKEFEYAAQQALRMGVGAFKVCAGDYGWHLIYVVDAFETAGGEVYSPEWTAERIEAEGTFENKFYEWIKDSTLSGEVSAKRSAIIKTFMDGTTVTKYENTYADLLEIEG